MTGLHRGFTKSDDSRDDLTYGAHAALPPQSDRSYSGRPRSENGMAELHESIAALLASQGQWQQAYHQLRSALDVMSTAYSPKVPEQLRHEVDRLRKERAEAREQSFRDCLTASYNRRYLDENLSTVHAKHAPEGVGIALVDLDHFKHINDTYGHLLGDRVLQRVVLLLQSVLPSGAFCARYGGEEFVLVMPTIDSATSIDICETSRQRVESFPWSQMAPGLRVTASIGLAHEISAPEQKSASMAAEQQLLSADALLYAAKQSGRNAVAYRAGSRVRLVTGAPTRPNNPAVREHPATTTPNSSLESCHEQ